MIPFYLWLVDHFDLRFVQTVDEDRALGVSKKVWGLSEVSQMSKKTLSVLSCQLWLKLHKCCLYSVDFSVVQYDLRPLWCKVSFKKRTASRADNYLASDNNQSINSLIVSYRSLARINTRYSVVVWHYEVLFLNVRVTHCVDPIKTDQSITNSISDLTCGILSDRSLQISLHRWPSQTLYSSLG